MDFNYYDLGDLQGGEIAEVTLVGNAANVKLLDGENYSLYKAAKPHEYYGGLATQSITKLQIPRGGHWFITVDMQGLLGSTKSTVKVTTATE
ncbi:MAG: DUF1883 domain-containing protein [Firmicutes bacterium]|nr:DUF1883 domain-containing protein [Bacillota bacterium]